MAKVPSDRLFLLVKSLSPSEKRYFRIFVRGRTEKDSRYLQLFEMMVRWKGFSDARYKKNLYPKNESSSKKFPELKNYLYNLILQCLGAYDHSTSVDSRLNQLMQNVLVLYRRGMYIDCRVQLTKAQALALSYERLSTALDILQWEKKIAYALIDVDFLVRELDRIEYEEKKLIRQIDNTAAYRRTFYKMLSIVKTEAAVRSKNKKKDIEDLIASSNLSDPDSALSHTARVYFYRTLNLYYYAFVEYENFYESTKTLIGLLESQPQFLKDSLSNYIATMSNYILSCGLLKKYEEVAVALDKLWKIKPITLDDAEKIRRQYFTSKFVLCIFTGDFKEGKLEVKRYLDLSRKEKIEEKETTSFYFQFFSISFGNQDYGEAMDWLNLWLSQPKTSDREDLQSLARMLELMLHFEMKNYTLCDSLLRSATRFISSKNRLYQLEGHFIKCLQKVLKTASTDGYEVLPFQVIKKDLSEIRKEADAKVLLQTFDVEAWIDSKISEKSFAEVVREKAKN